MEMIDICNLSQSIHVLAESCFFLRCFYNFVELRSKFSPLAQAPITIGRLLMIDSSAVIAVLHPVTDHG